MLGLSLSLSLGAGGRVPWSPSALGSSLLGWWDAEDASTITQTGGAVSSWRDKKAGYDATQALGSAKPVYSATSFNSRPGITFDGVDDELTLGSMPFPSGSSGSEIWALVDQTALPANTSVRRVLAYGNDLTTQSRYLVRAVVAGVNRGQMFVGDGAAAQSASNQNVDLSGRHVLRGVVQPSSFRCDVNDTSSVAVSAVPATAAVRTRIGANSAASAAGFWQGSINAVLITAPLTSDQATQLYTYLNARKGS